LGLRSFQESVDKAGECLTPYLECLTPIRALDENHHYLEK
jgi:hypothetical protein